MVRTITKEQAAAIAEEFSVLMAALPAIKQQVKGKIDLLSAADDPKEDDIVELHSVMQCVQDQVTFYADTFRSYSRRNGKLKNEAEKDSAENLEKYAAIRQQAEQIISEFNATEEAIFRQIRIRQMAKGIFTMPQPSAPQQNSRPQKDEIQFPAAPDEESDE